jgi:hypothetical protein
MIAFRGGLLIWAGDEIVRGVNPWRRCLGSAVAAYDPFAMKSKIEED